MTLLLLLPLLSQVSSLLACGGGSYEPTAISGVRVVAIVADPPEARPGDQVQATVWLGKTIDDPLDVMFWTCLYMEDGSCAEAQIADELEQWVTLGTDSAGTMVTAREIPVEAEDYLAEDPAQAGIQVFALACPEGACPIIEQVRLAMDEVGVDAGVAARLADPSTWMADLDMDQVSLATRQFIVSTRDPGTMNRNPEIEARFAESLDEAIVVAPGGTVDLAFHVDDPNGESVYCYPLTTLGTFEERKVKAEDEQVRLYLDAPATAGEGRIWVVFDDRDGGIAVYSQALVVQEAQAAP